jgi:dolichol-phosphate mannosyltransferase
MAIEQSMAIKIAGGFDHDVTVAVVIPTFNEADNIGNIVQQLFALDVEKLGILFVDDSSPDRTGEIADELAAQHPGRILVAHRAGKLGLGTAYIAGFKLALDNDVQRVVQMDCDLSHPPAEVPAMLDALLNSDVVVGTRYSDGGDVDPNWKMSRVLLSKWANFGIRTILGLKVHDATGGFKAYRRDALKTIDPERLTVAGFGFQAEVAYRAQQCGLNISEHPYTFMERAAGKSKMSLHIAIEAFWRLTLIRLKGI